MTEHDTSILRALAQLLDEAGHSHHALVEGLHLDYEDDEAAHAFADAIATMVGKAEDELIATANEELAKVRVVPETMAACREVARAWQAWCMSDVDGAVTPELCEGCSCPATTRDTEGVPLCDTCAEGVVEDVPSETAALLREGARLLEAVPTWGTGQADAVVAWLERVRAMVGVDDG